MFGSRNFLFAKVSAAGGQLWAWGRNNQSQLGQGSSTTDISSPVQVGSKRIWTQVSGGGYHVGGLQDGGKVQMWGSDSDGQIGSNVGFGRQPYGTSGSFSIANVAFVNAGRFQTRIVKKNGELWSWGNNTYGALGLGDTTNRSSPVQVGLLTDWVQVDAVGSFSCIAIKTDGTLWAWGDGGNGRLGLGNTTNYSSPKQVGSGWASTSHYGVRNRYAAGAIKTDGTLFTWGGGQNGRLGLGNTTSYSSPKQVGSGWSKLASHYAGFIAVKTNGKLYAWGRNQQGQLGLGDTTDRSVPVQVGLLTTWAVPIGGYYFNGCVKTDGTLWVWGQNNYGQLGLGNTTNYSSPKQIAGTSWISGSATDKSMMGIKT